MMKRLAMLLALAAPAAVFTLPASAQVPSPISGPNTPVPSPICALVNFGFCPQPAPPPPPGLPDPDAEAAAAARRPLPPPPAVPHHRHHRVRPPMAGEG